MSCASCRISLVELARGATLYLRAGVATRCKTKAHRRGERSKSSTGCSAGDGTIPICANSGTRCAGASWLPASRCGAHSVRSRPCIRRSSPAPIRGDAKTRARCEERRHMRLPGAPSGPAVRWPSSNEPVDASVGKSAIRDARSTTQSLRNSALPAGTDYVAMPMICSSGEINTISWATNRPGGFSEPELADLTAIADALAIIVELQSTRRVTRYLLDTYVGHRTGERVLSGAITRGSQETIHAVIWYCDLRGFTTLTDSLARTE